MHISPAADSAAVYASAPTQSPASKSSVSPAPTDSVHLSSAAKAQVGGDADHDGDSH